MIKTLTHAAILLLCCSLCSAQIPKAAKAIAGKYYKIGGNIKPPKPSETPDPALSKSETEKLKKAKNAGTVVLWIGIGNDGLVEAAYVVRSAGQYLDDKALEAVRQWKFQPATRDSVPVPVQVNVEVNFHLY